MSSSKYLYYFVIFIYFKIAKLLPTTVLEVLC